MSKIITPSTILECFVRNVKEDLPASESAKVDGYADAIAKTDLTEDSKRARRCFQWAYKMADDKSASVRIDEPT